MKVLTLSAATLLSASTVFAAPQKYDCIVFLQSPTIRGRMPESTRAFTASVEAPADQSRFAAGSHDKKSFVIDGREIELDFHRQNLPIEKTGEMIEGLTLNMTANHQVMSAVVDGRAFATAMILNDKSTVVVNCDKAL